MLKPHFYLCVSAGAAKGKTEILLGNVQGDNTDGMPSLPKSELTYVKNTRIRRWFIATAINTTDYHHYFRNQDGSDFILGSEVCTDWTFMQMLSITKVNIK